MRPLTIGELAKQSGVGVETIRFYGCPVCVETIMLINHIACSSCEVTVLDTNDPDVAIRAKEFGIRSLPAVVINGTPADCCTGRGPDIARLQAHGLGQPIR